MLHHTKNKGDLGVLKVKADLCEKGFTVLSPDTEHAPFDVVAYKDGVFKTIQVKYRAVDKGRIVINFRSSWADKNGIHEKPVDKSLIDWYAIYCPDVNSCFYFDPKIFGRSITFRVTDPIRDDKKIKYLADYKNIPT